MLRHARNKVNARRFDARMPENIRQLDDVLVCAVESCCKQMPQVVRKHFPRIDARADTQLFHLRPNLITGQSFAAFGAKDCAGGGFLSRGILEQLAAEF